MRINTPEELAKYIDFSNLDNTATKKDIEEFCQTAKKWGFYSVVISPIYVKLAKKLLKDSSIKIGTVIGFPLGFTDTQVKVKEAEIAIEDGADEIDMVVNIPAFKNGDYDAVKEDIEAIRSVIGNRILKVIIETSLLNEGEIKKISQEINKTSADFIKTNTGFNGINTFNEMVLYLQIIKTAGSEKSMKASGGIKDYKTINRLIAAGATRIGTSSGDIIVEEYKTLLENETYQPKPLNIPKA